MADLFISYARDDDEPFVKELYGRLTKAGFNVWWDRVSMPSRALTFLEEIRIAIHECERVVVVIGSHAATSDYVRAEWQYALADDKIVVPVLREGTHSLLPAELESLHCPDLTAPEPDSEAYRNLVQILREDVAALGDLHGAIPAMPPRFQPRPSDLNQLAELVLIDRKKPITITDAERAVLLHGIGGVGKSVLASAFARSTTTRRAFSDGVYWISAGTDSDEADLLQQLGTLCGIRLGAATEVAEMVTKLGQHLSASRCLIVLDNAWRVEQVAPFFKILGANGRLLISTRRFELAAATGARPQELRCLGANAALRHLAAWTGQAVEDLPPEARDLAAECGYLPFALALNGAMALAGNSWRDLLEALHDVELDFAEQTFADYPYPNVLKCIQLSMDMLAGDDPSAADRYRELAAYVADEGVPLQAVIRFWHYRSKLGARHCRKLATKLQGQGLLRIEGLPDAPRLVLHDLQRDYLRATGRGMKQLNHELLTAYGRSEDWATVPADGYFHQHLLDHLRLAQREEEFRELLSCEDARGKNAWQAANDAAANSAGYLRDVRRCLDWAASKHEPDIAAVVRYGLILTSVASRGSNIPPQVLAAAVRHDLMPPRRALNLARQQLDDVEIAKALEAIASLLDERLVVEALQVALAIGNDRERSQAMGDLAPHLAATELTTVLGIALRIEDLEQRAETLCQLVPHLDKSAARSAAAEALEAALSSGSEWSLANTVSTVLPHLKAKARRRAMDAILEFEDPWPKTEALISACEVLHGEEQRQQALLAIETIDQIHNDDLRVAYLAEVAPLLPESTANLLEYAEEEAWELDDETRCAEALSAISAHLDGSRADELLDAAISVAEDIKQEWRAEALELIAAANPMAVKKPGFIETARPLLRLGNGQDQEITIMHLADHLPVELAEDALEAVRSITFRKDRIKAFGYLTASLPPELERLAAEECLEAAAAINDQLDAVRTLLTLSGHASSSVRSRAVAIALSQVEHVERPYKRAETIEALASDWPEDLLPDGLRIAEEIPVEIWRSKALAALGERLPPALLEKAVATAGAIRGVGERVSGLSALAPHVPEARRREMLEQAWDATRGMDDVWKRLWAYLDLIPALPVEERDQAYEEALQTAEKVTEEDRGNGFEELARRLPSSWHGRVLRGMRGIKSPWTRCTAYLDLADVTSKEWRDMAVSSALEAAREVTSVRSQADLLVRVARHLTGPNMRDVALEALEAARAIDDEGKRAEALAKAIRAFPEGDDQQAVAVEAMEAARQLDDLLSRGTVMEALAESVPPDMKAEVVELTCEAPLVWDRGRTLAKLLPHLPEDLRTRASSIVLDGLASESMAWARANLLIQISDQLPDDATDDALRLLRMGWVMRRDAYLSLLASLAGKIERRWGGEAVAETIDAVGDVMRWWP